MYKESFLIGYLITFTFTLSYFLIWLFISKLKKLFVKWTTNPWNDLENCLRK